MNASLLPDLCQIITYTFPNVPWSILNSGDIAIYHLGNNSEFHRDIFQVSLKHPGMAVLHDTYLPDFFRGFYSEEGDPLGWQDQLERWHGPSARVQSESYLAGIGSFDEISRRFPLTKAAVENALGAVVHNSAEESNVQDLAIPLVHIPLPFGSQGEPIRLSPSYIRPPGAVRLIVFGHIGRNRGVDLILQALAALPNRKDFHLDIYGDILEVKSVRAAISSLQIADIVTLRGFVSAAELFHALERADLAINLRIPTMGEASQSQLEIWSHALPSVVSQTGWYASIPDSLVAFVRPDHEVEDLKSVLGLFLKNRNHFASMGRLGFEFLLAHHQPAQYATALADFAAVARAFNTRAAGYKLAERVGRKLTNTFEEVHSSVVNDLADKIQSLMG